MEMLENGLQTYFGVSSQSCRSIDADAWCKRVITKKGHSNYMSKGATEQLRYKKFPNKYAKHVLTQFRSHQVNAIKVNERHQDISFYRLEWKILSSWDRTSKADM